MKRLSLLWVFTALLVLPFSGQAKEVIYKWVDKDGVAHYSSHPPAGQKAEKVKVYGKKGSSVDVSKNNKLVTQQTQATPQPQPTETVAPPATVEPPPSRKNPEHCEKAKKNLWNLENYPRLRIEDPDTGERRMMSDDEKQQYMDEANAQVKEFCDD
ncbi:DUF4124 domain-containing protein [bacterium SCSIO 12696]|nr:DUF4124 domain-containing protein [bacterium SCSIO 12696]